MSYSNSTFSAGQIATIAGIDIRLYEITRQGYTWFYTNAEENITFNSNVYVSSPITDGGVKQKQEALSDSFEITLPTTEPIAQLFLGTPPADPIKVTMREMILNDPGGEAPIMWLGYIVSAKIKDEISTTITSATQGATLRREGLRLCYSRECPHVLYVQGAGNCRANPAAFAEVATVTEVQGQTFYFTYNAASPKASFTTRFVGGYFTFQSGTGGIFTEQRGVLNSYQTSDETGGSILVLGATDGLAVGMTITLYPGCQHTPEWCLDFFDNIDNYGGFAFLPGRSPFDGDPVF